MASSQATGAVDEPLLPSKVLVVGGSYGGLAAALNLLDLCHGRPTRFTPAGQSPVSTPQAKCRVQITIVDERDGYYNLIGSPLALASKEYAAKAWTKFQDIPALQHSYLRCVQGSVTRIDCARKVATIAETVSKNWVEESYDFLVASSGLRRLWPVVPQSLTRKEYLLEVWRHIQLTKDAREGVVVIGGGAVGIEMAAELKLVHPSLTVKLVHSREKLLSSEPLPDDFKDRTLSVLHETGVEVIMGCRVTETTPLETGVNTTGFKLTLSDGTSIVAGQVINATSTSLPSTSYFPRVALDEEGFVRVKPSLTLLDDVPNALSHFAIGDIAAWSGIKRCGGAMHMGHCAAMNIHRQLLHQRNGSSFELEELSEFPPFIGLAVGKKAVCYSSTTGTTSGEDLMEIMFGDDLGNTSMKNTALTRLPFTRMLGLLAAVKERPDA